MRSSKDAGLLFNVLTVLLEITDQVNVVIHSVLPTEKIRLNRAPRIREKGFFCMLSPLLKRLQFADRYHRDGGNSTLFSIRVLSALIKYVGHVTIMVSTDIPTFGHTRRETQEDVRINAIRLNFINDVHRIGGSFPHVKQTSKALLTKY